MVVGGREGFMGVVVVVCVCVCVCGGGVCNVGVDPQIRSLTNSRQIRSLTFIHIEVFFDRCSVEAQP